MKHLARALRKSQTVAERRLWQRLRNRQLEDCKFRRQQVIGPFIVDLHCLEPKLIIEVDGGQHADQAENDAQRTQYLEGLGYRVIRLWNSDVLGNTEGVLESIRRVLIATAESRRPEHE